MDPASSAIAVPPAARPLPALPASQASIYTMPSAIPHVRMAHSPLDPYAVPATEAVPPAKTILIAHLA
jgi:hypothetical protein